LGMLKHFCFGWFVTWERKEELFYPQSFHITSQKSFYHRFQIVTTRKICNFREGMRMVIIEVEVLCITVWEVYQWGWWGGCVRGGLVRGWGGCVVFHCVRGGPVKMVRWMCERWTSEGVRWMCGVSLCERWTSENGEVDVWCFTVWEVDQWGNEDG
jgi:hypothetical protein